METLKQVNLLIEKRGNELYEKAKNFDRIEINFKRYTAILGKMEEIAKHEDFLIIPVLKSGVFTLKYPEYSVNILFDAELLEDEVLVKADSYIVSEHETKKEWLYSCDFYLSYRVKKEDSYYMDNYRDSVTEIFQKQGRKEKELLDHLEAAAKSEMLKSFLGFVNVNGWLNYLMEHPEEKEISKKITEKSESGAEKKPAKDSESKGQKEPKEHVVRLNGVRITTSNNKAVNKIKSRKVTRIMECWSVRGHFRHYKNGKVVYVHPYEKGNGRKTPKKYNV